MDTFTHEPKPEYIRPPKKRQRGDSRRKVDKEPAARRIVVRYFVPAELLNDPLGLKSQLGDQFREDCAAKRLSINDDTIAVVRERGVPKGGSPIPEGHVAVHVKAWGRPLPR